MVFLTLNNITKLGGKNHIVQIQMHPFSGHACKRGHYKDIKSEEK